MKNKRFLPDVIFKRIMGFYVIVLFFIFLVMLNRIYVATFHTLDRFLDKITDIVEMAIKSHPDTIEDIKDEMKIILETEEKSPDGFLIILNLKTSKSIILPQKYRLPLNYKLLLSKIFNKKFEKKTYFHSYGLKAIRVLAKKIKCSNSTFLIIVGYESWPMWRRFLLTSSYVLLSFIIAFVISYFAVKRILYSILFSLTKFAEYLKKVDLSHFSELKEFRFDRNIEELDILYKTIVELIDRIRKSYEREKQFFSNIAHELRTPIAGLRNTIELAFRKDRTSEEYKKILSKSLDIVLHIQKSFEELRLLAKLENDEKTFQKEKINLKEILNEILNYYTEEIERKKLKINLNLTESFVYASKESVSIILKNLISNAVKYTPNGKFLNISLIKNTLKIENYTSDLKKEDLDKIWERFWQKDKSRSSSGLGIGLNLVKEFARINKIKIKTKLKDRVFSIILIFG